MLSKKCKLLWGVLLIAMVFGLGTASAFAAPVSNAATLLEPVNELKNGEKYVVMIRSAALADGGNGMVALAPGSVNHTPRGVFIPGQEDRTFDLLSLCWTVELSGKTVALRCDAGYLTIDAQGVTVGPTAQYLTAELSSSSYTFSSRTDAGVNYLRYDPKTETFIPGNVGYRFTVCRVIDLPQTNEKPILTIACLSDLHVDYGIQSWKPPIRPNTIKTCEALWKEDQPDVLVTGGDLTSNNARKVWTESQWEAVKEQFRNTLGAATEKGLVLYTAGNHDYEAGESARKFFNSANYTDIMLEDNGEFVSAYYQPGLEFENLLCYRYNFNGVEFLVVNSVFEEASQVLLSAQLDWVKTQMKEIGKEATVVLTCHYPLTSIDKANGSRDAMTSVLKSYPNILYCYGHIHGNDDWIVKENTVELLKDTTSTALGASRMQHTGSILTYMGSMGFYNTTSNPGGLQSWDPKEAQAMIIYIYSDRIVFQMKNYAQNPLGEMELQPYVVARTFVESVPKSTEPDTDLTDDSGSFAETDTVSSVMQSENPFSDRTVMWVAIGGGALVVIVACVGFILLKKKK